MGIDKMSSTHNKKHITTIENTTDISLCAFHCKADARCNFWTLHTDNKYCDLFGEEGNLREDEEHCLALSEHFEENCFCSPGPNNNITTTPLPICTPINETYNKECLNADRDSEHCQDIGLHPPA